MHYTLRPRHLFRVMLLLLSGLLVISGFAVGARAATQPGAATPTADFTVWLPLLLNPGTSVGESGSFRTAVTPTADDDFSSAEFSLWIPEDLAVVRGVIIYGPGCGASSLTDKPGTARAELARKWGLAFMGMQFKDKPDGKTCGWSRAERSGSAAAAIQALNTFAQETSRPELVNAPWLTYGMSGGAGWAMDMAITYPERTIAAFPRGAKSSRGNLPDAYGVPIMLSAGENDGFLSGMRDVFTTHRTAGALWSLAVTPNEGHVLGDSWDMALVFFDAVLQQRLPASAPTDGPVELLPLDPTRAWLGNNDTFDIAAAADYAGEKLQAAWLPDETTATTWQTFVTTGKVE